MCRSKQDGGKRCKSHSPANRRLGRAAMRIYSQDSHWTRSAVESLPPKFVYGTIAERAEIAATTTDPLVKILAHRDPKQAVRDAWAENHHAKIFEGTPKERRDDFYDALNTDDVDVYVDDYANDRNWELRALVAENTRDPAVHDALLQDRSSAVRDKANQNFCFLHIKPGEAEREQENRKLGKDATRIFGKDNSETRRRFESLDPTYTRATVAERAHIAATTTDEHTLLAGYSDNELAVRNAAGENPITVAAHNERKKEKHVEDLRYRRRQKKEENEIRKRIVDRAAEEDMANGRPITPIDEDALEEQVSKRWLAINGWEI